jgi:hypothetical protein
MKLSADQERVTLQIKSYHMQIIAVAGCGKTTTNLFICQKNSDKNILLLTYNASLKMETKQKMEKMNITNAKVYTYHSFAYKRYKKCTNDYGLYEICKENIPPKEKFSFDIIILDEMQDMTRLYFDFVIKIYNDNQNKKVHFCILGDPFQTIYQYNGSDTNYFLYFPKISKLHYVKWKKCVLNHTFRCTNQVANFLNISMVKEQRILTSKESQKVRYIICDTFSNKIFAELQYYFHLGYSHRDIFILSPSVKSSNSPISLLSELCIQDGIPVFISYSDEDKPNEKVLENKLVFLTFHQSKGLERKVVIVMNFDNSYFMYYKKDQDPEVCPNELYVAVTRSKERLSIIHDYRNRHLPFLNTNSIHHTADLIVHKEISYERAEKKFNERNSELLEDESTGFQVAQSAQNPPISKSVMHVIKNMQFKNIYTAVQCLNITNIDPKTFGQNTSNLHQYIELPSVVEQGHIYENVSNINSLLIMSLYEYRKTGSTAISREYPNFIKYYESGDIPALLQLCNIKSCKENHFKFKLFQITNYNWVNSVDLEQCVSRLLRLPISADKCVFEQPIKYTNILSNKTLTGRIDCIDEDNIWEFKCVASLDYQHFLQICLYMYVFMKTNPEKNFNYFLYNVYENIILKIELKSQNMIGTLQDLIEESFHFQNNNSAHSFPFEIFQ